jgi:hypothetical protein
MLKDKFEMEYTIISIIEAHRGIFGQQLALIMVSDACPHTLDEAEYIKTLNKLLKDGSIVELPYNIAGMEGSVYFPKGTVFNNKR